MKLKHTDKRKKVQYFNRCDLYYYGCTPQINKIKLLEDVIMLAKNDGADFVLSRNNHLTFEQNIFGNATGFLYYFIDTNDEEENEFLYQQLSCEDIGLTLI
jgi:hypothetical protein